MSWTYFERLWCVYEWAGFLANKEVSDVTLCVGSFLRPSTLQLYVDSVKNFSVANCQCTKESDRAILLKKVDAYYVSVDKFEEFARSTGLAVLAMECARRADKDAKELEIWLKPWVDMARGMGNEELASVLGQIDPLKWRSQAQQDSSLGDGAKAHGVWIVGGDASSRAWQDTFVKKCEAWFVENVAPVLNKVKMTALKGELSGK